MPPLGSYRELIVWQKSLDLVEQVYRLTPRLPPAELYGLSSQMRRAVVSIASNVAAGQSRNSTGEFLQSLGVARGSLAELETQPLIATRLAYLPQAEVAPVLALCEEVSKMLNALIKKLRSRR